MIYAGAEGGETKNVPDSKAENAVAYVLSDEESSISPARPATSRSTTAGEWYWKWPKEAKRPSLYTRSRRARNVQSRIDVTASEILHHQEDGRTLITAFERRTRCPAGACE